MSARRKTALAAHRRGLKLRGMIRLEVQVRRDDAKLVRDIARALRDPARAAGTRAMFRDAFAAQHSGSLKDLLTAAPLEGIELRRAHDRGRPVDL